VRADVIVRLDVEIEAHRVALGMLTDARRQAARWAWPAIDRSIAETIDALDDVRVRRATITMELTT
jgi:hypothetical protein